MSRKFKDTRTRCKIGRQRISSQRTRLRLKGEFGAFEQLCSLCLQCSFFLVGVKFIEWRESLFFPLFIPRIFPASDLLLRPSASHWVHACNCLAWPCGAVGHMYLSGKDRNSIFQNCTVQASLSAITAIAPNDSRNLKTIWEKVLYFPSAVFCSFLTTIIYYQFTVLSLVPEKSRQQLQKLKSKKRKRLPKVGLRSASFTIAGVSFCVWGI